MEYQVRYHDIKAKLGPFRLKTDYETVKTVATIDALADRGDMLRRGCSRGIVFPGTDIMMKGPGMDAEYMISKAEGYLDELMAGRFPLKGYFSEPGKSFVDHSFIEKDGVMHVFYNVGSIGYDWPEIPHDRIGHAWSEDLINWNYGPPAITSNMDRHQCYQVWSPAVIKHDGRYWMYYTGVNRVATQFMCAAVSDDLFHWEQVEKNPVYVPGEWCPWSESHWSDCRDYFIFKDDDGTFYNYFCTSRIVDDQGHAEPASGIIRSKDMLHWEEVTTFRMPNCFHAAESPFVLKRNGLYYFFYTAVGLGTSYAVSDNPVDGWKEIGVVMGVDEKPADLAWVPSCAEVFEFKGKWYISCCVRQPSWEQYLQIHELKWLENGGLEVSQQRIFDPIRGSEN